MAPAENVVLAVCTPQCRHERIISIPMTYEWPSAGCEGQLSVLPQGGDWQDMQPIVQGGREVPGM